ncbi:hypothetical protein [Flaviflexus equikiangi]|uniref:Uncharacterized protein n=1 Tax=Flaviflexus equikiangi TaxID=2758573 RepID=A0ABS2TJT7_9ACTO|nr:hypothetical protein [Flaviflexus equikiangi]MBM9433796.1 hypothetical protein [Flaviflexus equikiangi]
MVTNVKANSIRNNHEPSVSTMNRLLQRRRDTAQVGKDDGGYETKHQRYEGGE